ncbi:hypothetical protein [Methylobacterium nodulans]|uniref:Uncharacterized protein n=1 Tax=Methylobacterium nodulans (strain LMG 21967 / CNCM I-2342 / ORS 2060) TaxID=460265 RepID=B8IB80_METNO|nr:hypothetical protein [Methylobacterium nodulans]ACL57295.1 hypothetical protein Mnod_2319 [Methylobacterium nodulans ORS 2060]
MNAPVTGIAIPSDNPRTASEVAGILRALAVRQEGIVIVRRERQRPWHHIAAARIETQFATLHGLFCRRTGAAGQE